MNKTNLELKHFCPNFNKIRFLLKELGAKKEITKTQTDYFFDTVNLKARLKLRVEGKKQLLVYYERPDFAEGKSATAKIKLYEVKDHKLLPFLQETLGAKVVVRKTRELWRKANTVFHLDKVEGVGSVFEIELQKNGKITEADKKQFKLYQDKLLPFLGKVIKGSNADLVSKK